MVLKQEVIKERLKALAEATGRLAELERLPFDKFAGDYRNVWLAERGLQISAEALFDIGSHVLSGHFRATAKDYEDITRLLGERGVITPALTLRLKGLGGFRNIIVHDYLEIDPRKVHEHLQKGLPDFAEFARQILAWLDRRRSEGS